MRTMPTLEEIRVAHEDSEILSDSTLLSPMYHLGTVSHYLGPAAERPDVKASLDFLWAALRERDDLLRAELAR